MAKTFKIKKTMIWQLISLVLLIALAASIFTNGFRFGASTVDGTGTTTTGTTGTATGATSGTPLKLLADDIVKGNKNAPLTIFVYSDPSCPYCAAAAGNPTYGAYMKSRDPTWEAPIPGIIKNYVDTGKVKLVFRFFPGHGLGEESMKYMLCANEQGKFWELHDIVFNAQDDLNPLVQEGDMVKVNAKLDELAKSANIDTAKVAACLASNKYASKLTNDMTSGKNAKLYDISDKTITGISGTPAFVINDKLVSGAVSFTVMKSIIDSELAK